jgi:hypothetical protein
LRLQDTGKLNREMSYTARGTGDEHAATKQIAALFQAIGRRKAGNWQRGRLSKQHLVRSDIPHVLPANSGIKGLISSPK